MLNKQLKEYLDKRMNQPTVILCFRILLENVIIHPGHVGLTKPEIAKKFNKDASLFGVQKFRTDYILRQVGTDKNAIENHDEKFFIKNEFLKGLNKEEMIGIVNSINDSYSNKDKLRRELYKEFKNAKKLSIEEKYKFICDLLLNRETGRKGQAFEVTAFAILKVYYSTRGFELNRFSTIYSNDGGIDYASQSSIYQVTTVMTDSKFDEDMLKAPLKNRIFVFRKAVPNFQLSRFNHELITDYICADDLIDHLNYIFKKNSERHSQSVLDTILAEYQREFYILKQ